MRCRADSHGLPLVTTGEHCHAITKGVPGTTVEVYRVLSLGDMFNLSYGLYVT